MRLRRPCEHGRYDEHWSDEMPVGHAHCPGGEFLADDTLIIERPVGLGAAEWVSTLEYLKGILIGLGLRDALAVREAAE